MSRGNLWGAVSYTPLANPPCICTPGSAEKVGRCGCCPYIGVRRRRVRGGMSVSGEALSAGPMQTDPYALLFLTRSLYVLSVCKAREPCRRVKALYFLTTDMAISDDRIHQTECR